MREEGKKKLDETHDCIMAGWSLRPFTLQLFDSDETLVCGLQRYVIERILLVHKCVMKFALVRGVKHGKEKLN